MIFGTANPENDPSPQIVDFVHVFNMLNMNIIEYVA